MTKSGAQAACDSLSFLVAAGGASAACGGFGFALNTAATFDVFYRLQVTNYGVLYVLFDSAPSGSNYIDVWDLSLHAQTASQLFRSNVLATSPGESNPKSCSNRDPQGRGVRDRCFRRDHMKRSCPTDGRGANQSSRQRSTQRRAHRSNETKISHRWRKRG